MLLSDVQGSPVNIYQITIVKENGGGLTYFCVSITDTHFYSLQSGGTMVSYSRRSLWLVSALIFFAISLGACATMEEASGSSSSNEDRLVFNELSMSLSGKTAYEVIEEIQPQWLRKRGRSSINNPEEVNVYLEGTEYGPVSSLRQISAENVDYVEHFSSGEAQFRFGPGNTQGAIAVYLRSQ